MTCHALGAYLDGDGTSFAVYSSVAEAVEVCVFDDDGSETRHQLEPDEGYVWRGHVREAGHGTSYGFRVHGPWDPGGGLRSNPDKLLLDPYARAIAGGVRWHPSVSGDHPGDSAPYVPLSIVCGGEFDWSGDRRPSDGARGLDHL